jgi:hypothetical protein
MGIGSNSGAFERRAGVFNFVRYNSCCRFNLHWTPSPRPNPGKRFGTLRESGPDRPAAAALFVFTRNG